jgi:thioredoxin 1
VIKPILLGAGALIIIGAVGYVVYQNQETTPTPTTNVSQSNTEATSQDDTATPAQISDTAGSYENYDKAKLANAQDGNVVLFFNASWCPDCRATVNDINANLGDIPSDLTILSVDYDTYTDLRKQYGVTYQHTFVQVDENGNQLKKWSGSFTLDDIVSQVE